MIGEFHVLLRPSPSTKQLLVGQTRYIQRPHAKPDSILLSLVLINADEICNARDALLLEGLPVLADSHSDVALASFTTLNKPCPTFDFVIERGQSVSVLPHEHHRVDKLEEHVFSFPSKAQGSKRKRKHEDEHEHQHEDEHEHEHERKFDIQEQQPNNGSSNFFLPEASGSLVIGRQEGFTTLLVSQKDHIVEYLPNGTLLGSIKVPFVVNRFVRSITPTGNANAIFAISCTGYRVWKYDIKTRREDLVDWTPSHHDNGDVLLQPDGGHFVAIEDDDDVVVLVTDQGRVAWTSHMLAGLNFFRFKCPPTQGTNGFAICSLQDQMLIGRQIVGQSFEDNEMEVVSFFGPNGAEAGDEALRGSFFPSNAKFCNIDDDDAIAICFQEESTLRLIRQWLPGKKLGEIKVDRPIDCAYSWTSQHLFILCKDGLEVKDLGPVDELCHNQCA